MIVFENLKLLKRDMEQKGWCIDSFIFRYKNQDYIVLVKLYDVDEVKPDYALLKLEFLRQGDIEDTLLVAANSAKLFVDARDLRAYFNIEYGENIGDIINQFYKHLAQFIPQTVTNDKNDTQTRIMVHSLSISEHEDPEKIYCKKVKRNPTRQDGTLGQRSPYNDNKTRLLRPVLYERLGADTNLSFCYSRNPLEGKSDELIITNWARN